MSDEMAQRKEAEQQQLAGVPEGKSVTLSVTLHPNGQIDFSLPTGNKILAYGMVEVARAQLDKLFLAHEMKRQAPAPGGVNGLLRRMNGG